MRLQCIASIRRDWMVLSHASNRSLRARIRTPRSQCPSTGGHCDLSVQVCNPQFEQYHQSLRIEDCALKWPSSSARRCFRSSEWLRCRQAGLHVLDGTEIDRRSTACLLAPRAPTFVLGAAWSRGSPTIEARGLRARTTARCSSITFEGMFAEPEASCGFITGSWPWCEAVSIVEIAPLVRAWHDNRDGGVRMSWESA